MYKAQSSEYLTFKENKIGTKLVSLVLKPGITNLDLISDLIAVSTTLRI